MTSRLPSEARGTASDEPALGRRGPLIGTELVSPEISGSGRRRRIALLLLQSFLGLGLLIARVRLVDLSSVAGRLAAMQWPFVVVALGLGLLAYLARTARWRLLLRPIARLPLGDIIPIVFASTLINFLLPLRTGELARSLLLKQRRGVTVAGSLATVAVDRAFDLAIVLALAAVGAVLVPTGASLGPGWGLVGRASSWPSLR